MAVKLIKCVLDLLTSCFKSGSQVKLATMKDNACIQYALLRQTKLRELWKAFFMIINCQHIFKEPLVSEIVNESLFEGIVEEMFATTG